ncbi:MAG TPA: hypothetical protein VGL93_06185 [Streptosporangiaceae bacterium]|jgi:hypothetical protein
MELHSGLSGATKGVLGCLLVFCVVVLVPILAAICAAFASLASVVLAWVVGLLIAFGTWALVVGRLLWVLRSAAWMEGSTLVVRGAFTTRRADLARTPRIILDSVAETTSVPVGGSAMVVATGRRIPRLTAFDPAGKAVRLNLVNPSARQWLAPPKLLALAGAIVSAPRPEPLAAEAWRVASGLRAMANDPTGQIR